MTSDLELGSLYADDLLMTPDDLLMTSDDLGCRIGRLELSPRGNMIAS